ncbi:chitin binding peritrophin-A domain-containing protein [Sorangium cellulosum]
MRNSFYQCVGIVAVLHRCPAGLVFDPTLDVCDWPSNHTCEATCD